MRWLIVLVILLASCGGGYVDSTDGGPSRPDPPLPPDGTAVRSIELENTTYTLYAEGDCVVVEMVTPGLMGNVERYCPGQDYPVTASDSCAWAESELEPDRRTCEAYLPTVLFGRVTSSDVGWVCIATRPSGSLTTNVRFLDFSDDGYILVEQRPDEEPAAHMFAHNGARFGTPPLDAPSIDIYRACEAAAPWGDDVANDYEAEVRLVLDSELARENLIITLDTGLGEGWVSGAAGDHGVIDILQRIGGGSDGIRIRVLDPEPTAVFSHRYEWPEQLQEIVDSDRSCGDPIQIEVAIGRAVLLGDPDAITVSVGSDPCDPSG
jgi:hypothetical protein